MGFLDKTINEEKLNELSFLSCVKWLRDTSERLSYSKGSSSAYWEARELIQYLIKRFEKEIKGGGFASKYEKEIEDLLTSTESSLSDYSTYAKADRDKAEAIAIFKSDMEENTRRIISDIENKK